MTPPSWAAAGPPHPRRRGAAPGGEAVVRGTAGRTWGRGRPLRSWEGCRRAIGGPLPRSRWEWWGHLPVGGMCRGRTTPPSWAVRAIGGWPAGSARTWIPAPEALPRPVRPCVTSGRAKSGSTQVRRSRFPQRALVHQLGYLTAMRSRPIASGVSLGLAALAIVGTGRCGADGGPRPSLGGRGRRDSGICPLVRVEVMLGRRLTPGPRSGGCRMTRAGQQAVGHEPERHQECRQDRQRLRLVRPVPPARCGRCARHDECGRGVVEDVSECQRLPDQRLRGVPGRLGYGADVAPRVKVAAACGVVVVFDIADECFPNAGPLADLGNGKASLVACLC